jgi:hypothetical protein
MKYEYEIDQRSDDRQFRLTIPRADFLNAQYLPHELGMIRALEEQQEQNPTCEGMLMIVQMHVRVIERSQGVGEG